MIRFPAFVCSTRRNPSTSWSTSMKSYGTRCSPKNFLARLQSWHHVVPYMVILFGCMFLIVPRRVSASGGGVSQRSGAALLPDEHRAENGAPHDVRDGPRQPVHLQH